MGDVVNGDTNSHEVNEVPHADTGDHPAILYTETKEGNNIFTFKELPRDGRAWEAFGMLVAVIAASFVIHRILKRVIKAMRKFQHAKRVIHHIYTEFLLLGILSLFLEFTSAVLSHAEEVKKLFEWAHILVFFFAILFAFTILFLLLRITVSSVVDWHGPLKAQQTMLAFEEDPVNNFETFHRMLRHNQSFLFVLARYLFLLNTYGSLPNIPARKIDFVHYLRRDQRGVVANMLQFHSLQWCTIIGLTFLFISRQFWFHEHDDTNNFLVLFGSLFTLPFIPFLIFWFDLAVLKTRKCALIYRQPLHNLTTPKHDDLTWQTEFQLACRTYQEMLQETLQADPFLADHMLFGKRYYMVMYRCLAFCLICLLWILAYIGLHTYTIWKHVDNGKVFLPCCLLAPTAFIMLLPFTMRHFALLISLREEAYSPYSVLSVAKSQGLISKRTQAQYSFWYTYYAEDWHDKMNTTPPNNDVDSATTTVSPVNPKKAEGGGSDISRGMRGNEYDMHNYSSSFTTGGAYSGTGGDAYYGNGVVGCYGSYVDTMGCLGWLPWPCPMMNHNPLEDSTSDAYDLVRRNPRAKLHLSGGGDLPPRSHTHHNDEWSYHYYDEDDDDNDNDLEEEEEENSKYNLDESGYDGYGYHVGRPWQLQTQEERLRSRGSAVGSDARVKSNPFSFNFKHRPTTLQKAANLSHNHSNNTKHQKSQYGVQHQGEASPTFASTHRQQHQHRVHMPRRHHRHKYHDRKDEVAEHRMDTGGYNKADKLPPPERLQRANPEPDAWDWQRIMGN